MAAPPARRCVAFAFGFQFYHQGSWSRSSVTPALFSTRMVCLG